MLLFAEESSWLMQLLLGGLMFVIALFLILLVLVQRGRGGGLTGALGGMGGQSAFGTKAGDVFTKITMVTATVWILVCMISIKVLQPTSPLGSETSGLTGPSSLSADPLGTGTTTDDATDTDTKASDKKATDTKAPDTKTDDETVAPPASTEAKADETKAESEK